jgi:hypothetical protein
VTKRITVWVVAASAFVAVMVSGAVIISSVGARDLGVSIPRAAQPTPTQVETTIVLDPPYNYTQFSPPAPGDEAAITADGALALFKAVAPDFMVPEDATAQLGLYTVSSAWGEYAHKDQLSWGFSWHRCPSATEARHPGFTPSPDDPCTFWLFLDAKTGEMLVAQYQR